VTSEAQLAADLSRRHQFIEPFLLACSSKNAKFAATGVGCLQRLAVLGALPRNRLKEILDAIRDCSSLSQDVQLKVLQILPSILQRHVGDVRGPLLFSLLQTCSLLQASKVVAVSSTAAATFNQILSALFEELQREDRRALEIPTSAEAVGLQGPVQIRPVAHDAVRVFADLSLLASGSKPASVRLSALPETSCLELVEAVLANYSELVGSHTELAYVVKAILLPHLLATFKEKRPFPVIVRVARLMYMIVRSHHHLFPEECAQVLESFNHVLDQTEAQASWKRVICLEIYRGIFMEPQLILALYAMCDQQPEGKPIIRSCTASFVRLASEKPALIGLSQQSTVPIGNYFQRESGAGTDVEASSTATNAEGTAGVGTSAVPGISNQYSSVRAPFIDQLDKSDAPTMPDTYVYSLVLLCLNNLADSLAKFVLPLTVQRSSKVNKKSKPKQAEEDETETASQENAESSIKRTPSLRRRNVPVNPLTLDSHPAFDDIKTAAALIDQCWPAILASCSTFFNAALDSDHYRALVRSFQKFAQVAGLLRMATPRDAFLTTLGKTAVPAHLIAAIFSPATASVQSPSLLRSATGLLNVENLVNQASTLLPDRGRRTSLDAADNNTLSSRNLLCLRALLNLAIALGPTLENSWTIIFETLQQADKIMATVNLRPMSRDSRSPMQTPVQAQGEFAPAQTQVMASELSAIQAAASRLFESTTDFPNDSFVHLLQALCLFVDPRQATSAADSKSPPPTPGVQHRRVPSFSGISASKSDTATKDFVFALSKIRELISANIERFVVYPPGESGWTLFTGTITAVATHAENPSTARMLATDLLSRLTRDIVSAVADADPDLRAEIHLRALKALSTITTDLDDLSEAPGSDDTSNEVHSIVLETLRAIVEQIGDVLTGGWDIVFEIICTAFATVEDQGEMSTLKTISLGRSAFASTQLVCSDFLASVPDAGLLTLVETIRRFAVQGLDLNMSLTATTLFWNLSDLLYGRLAMSDLDEYARSAESVAETKTQSLPALWALLLSRIRDTASDPREEVRTGAISTLIRIFNNHGDDLSTDSWQLVLMTILLPLLDTDAKSLQNIGDAPAEAKGRETTTKLVLDGVAKLVSTYIEVVITCEKFPSFWSNLASTFAGYLAHGLLDVDRAVFDAISTLLGAVQTPDKLGNDLIQEIARIWARYDPPKESQGDTNQDAYLSYIRALHHIYRLSAQMVTMKTIQGIVDKLHLVIATSGASPYSNDTDSMTKLQKEVLDVTALLRTDIDDAPSSIATLLADFISLPFEEGAARKNRPTFVAVAKASMDAAAHFVQQHIERRELFEEALLKLLQALEVPIRLKYSWKVQGKKHVLWQKSTTTALKLLEGIIPRLATVELTQSRSQQYWDVVVAIGKGIASAEVEQASQDTAIFDDEDFDVDALTKFRQIVIPALGSDDIADTTRRAYARALFDNSIVHEPETDELPDLDLEPLKELYYIRFGRTYNPEPTLRGSMAYHCLGDLLSLVAKQDSSPPRVKLAQAAAPYLILRSAITLRLYIADHPLRGRFMPLPSSQREELLFVLKRARELESEARAIPETEGLATVSKRHLVRLYPLVVKAVEVEGRRARPDEDLLGEMRKVLEAVGKEFML
jgi:hypothetical protein